MTLLTLWANYRQDIALPDHILTEDSIRKVGRLASCFFPDGVVG